MDRNSILALILIFIILLLWGPYSRWLSPPPEPQETETTQEPPKRAQKEEQAQTGEQQRLPEQPLIQERELGSIQKTGLPKQSIVIESPLYRGIISTKGGTIEEWVLTAKNDKNEYKYPDPSGEPVNLIRNNDTGNLALTFHSAEDFQINLADFDFVPENITTSRDQYTIFVNDRVKSLTMTADLGDNRKIRKRFMFDPNSLHITMEIEFENCQNLISNQQYSLIWGTGIRTSEANLNETKKIPENSVERQIILNRIEDDMRYAKSMALYGTSKEVKKFDIKKDFDQEELKPDIHWIATRNKYFCALIIPTDALGKKVQFSGQSITEEEEALLGRKNYVTKLTMGYKSSSTFTNEFLVYLGPVDYKKFKALSKEFNTDLKIKEVLDYSAWYRPLTMPIYRVFLFLHSFIPNYGLVIIVFSILINLFMYPLTAKSYKSMKKMQEMQPLMTELREKYKKEPQKLQQAQMKLYKEHKINPVGGCLPMLLQMPIFISLYPIFSSIELRGAQFIWWIKDLSQPDTVATIPTILPFNNLMYGNQFNVLVIIYAITLFIQQKIMMKDPKQKMMVYFMPIMLLLLLNRWSSGFILYWLFFNLLSIIQRYLVRDKGEPNPKPALAPLQVKSHSKKSSKSKKGKKR